MDFQNYKALAGSRQTHSQFNMSFAQQLQNSSHLENLQLSPQQEPPNRQHMQIVESSNSLVEAPTAFPGLVNDSFSLAPNQYDTLMQDQNLSLGSPQHSAQPKKPCFPQQSPQKKHDEDLMASFLEFKSLCNTLTE